MLGIHKKMSETSAERPCFRPLHPPRSQGGTWWNTCHPLPEMPRADVKFVFQFLNIPKKINVINSIAN